MVKQGLKIAYPIFWEKFYEKKLLTFTRGVNSLVKNDLYSFLQSNNEYKFLRKNDDFNDDFKRFLEFLSWKIEFETKKLLSKLLNISISVNQFHEKAFFNSSSNIKSSLRVSEFTLKNIHIDNELKMWIAENTRLIKTIPSNLLGKVEEAVFNSVRIGYSYRTLAEELEKAFKVSKNRARIIARDQISKFNGSLTRQRNLSLGITEYRWLTSRDERVRHSHEVLEDKICSWKDANIYKDKEEQKWKKRDGVKAVLLHPGQDILCRCTSVAIINI